MEDNRNTRNTTNTDAKGLNSKGGAGTGTDTADTRDTAADSITMSKADFEKAVKDAGDKARTEMEKQIQDLEEKVKELNPVEKTQAEIEIEERLAKLEVSEKALADRERKIAVQEKLSANGLDKGLAGFLKDDADVDRLSSLVDGIVKSKMKQNGYKPVDHSSDDKVTPEEFAKWPYSKKAEFAERHPEAYKRLRGKSKYSL